MKNKLKTLKDFKVNPKSWAGAMANAGRKYTIDIPELKQEAIKWVKELSKDGIKENVSIWKWTKHFFNITEEDLKSKPDDIEPKMYPDGAGVEE